MEERNLRQIKTVLLRSLAIKRKRNEGLVAEEYEVKGCFYLLVLQLDHAYQ